MLTARRALVALAAVLGASSYAAVWWSLTLCGLLAAGAGLCWLLAEMLRYVALFDDPLGYDATPQGAEAADWRRWAEEMAGTDRRPVWPFSSGAPE